MTRCGLAERSEETADIGSDHQHEDCGEFPVKQPAPHRPVFLSRKVGKSEIECPKANTQCRANEEICHDVNTVAESDFTSHSFSPFRHYRSEGLTIQLRLKWGRRSHPRYPHARSINGLAARHIFRGRLMRGRTRLDKSDEILSSIANKPRPDPNEGHATVQPQPTHHAWRYSEELCRLLFIEKFVGH